MRAVIAELPPDIRQFRKRTGADRWDEMWEGVLHMPPMPNRTHQELEGALEAWLRFHWARPLGNKVYHQINLASPGGWPDDYRIPDLVLLTPERFEIDHDEHFEGPPAVVAEIRSPDDETYEKMPFYAKLGVPEMWVIDRDTKTPQIYVLAEGRYQRQSPGADGWLCSAATGVRFRGEAENKLAVQRADQPDTRELLPED